MHVRRIAISLLFGAVLSLASGCSVFSSGPVEEKEGPCNLTPCLRISISTPLLDDEGIDSEVKKQMEGEIAKVLYAPISDDREDGQDESSLSARAAAQAMVQDLKARFNEQFKEDPHQASLDWWLERNAQEVFRGQEVVTVEITNRGYLGGAHGFEERSFLSFDRRDGHTITLGELFGPGAGATLETIIELEFRRVRNIPMGQLISDAGFTLRTDKGMRIPDTFGITESGILFHYNPYEIAPFALGPTELVLPKDAIAPLMKRDASIFDPRR